VGANLRRAGSVAARAPERADDLLAAQEAAAEETVATLVRLSRGIYPPLLEAHGPGAALRAAVEHAGGLVLVGDAGGGAGAPRRGARALPGAAAAAPAGAAGRYAPNVEAAAYFCCLEAVQ